MLFEMLAASANDKELDELLREEHKKKQTKEEETLTRKERALHAMEEEVQESIDENEKKLRKESEKIAHLQHKIDKEVKKYVDLEHELDKDEAIEGELQEEKLKRADKKLAKIKNGRDSPVKEELEEVLHEMKIFAKDVVDTVGEKCWGKSEEPKIGSSEEEKAAEKKSKMEKKLNEATKRIKDLRKELLEKSQAMFKEDDEILQREAHKVQKLQQQLKDEERLYSEIVAELSAQMEYETRIRKEELKLMKLKRTEKA